MCDTQCQGRAYRPQSKKYIIILYYVKPARIRLHLAGHKLLSLSCSDGKLLVFDAHTGPGSIDEVINALLPMTAPLPMTVSPPSIEAPA